MKQEGYTHLVGKNGYLLSKVPQDIMGEIKTSVDEVQNNFNKATPYNKYLAGQIDKEYQINLTHKATQYIKHSVEQYCNANPKYINSIYSQSTQPPTLTYGGNAWINFQEKYEYNPIHRHDGILSYVIWYQIPFYKKDEVEHGAGKDKMENRNQNGDFSFVFYDGDEVVSLDLGIDKTMEGYIAMFPSSLNHVVYPFYTSNDYRITVSGNIHLQGQ